jgi:hypothetical protein
MNISSVVRVGVAAMIAIAVVPCVVIGQDAVKDSRISGRIVDRRGVPVRNRPVVLRHLPSTDTNVITSTDGDGTFNFTAVAAASYEMTFEMPGFKRMVVPVTVTGDNHVNIGTVVLEVVPIGDGIEVTPYTAPVSQSLNPSAQGSSEGRQFRGRYANIDYGFSVEIPAQVVGEGTAAPAPNHGFAIRFDQKSVLWLDASYDVTEPPHRFGRINSRLGNLKAERRSWSETAHGVNLFHEAIVARGVDRQTPIIYTIQVDTTTAHRPEALRVFEALISSFHTIPIRP